NFRDVLVVVDPKRYPDVLAQLDRPGGSSIEFRFELARDAFKHTGSYDLAIWGNLLDHSWQEQRFVRGPGRQSRPATTIEVQKVRDLRYGENPHQFASLWEDPRSPLGLTIVQGKELSFTNLIDLDAAWRLVAEFDEPAAAVIKHTNPCGAATGASAADAYVRARDADALSAFGGIVGLNRPLDTETAAAITSTFVEAVIAPSVADAARPILATREKMRVVLLDAPSKAAAGTQRGTPSGADDWNPWWEMEWRSVFGGLLLQERDRVSEARDIWPSGDSPTVATRRQPTAQEWQALRFAWRICAHVKSNAVIFTDGQRTLAMGAGQTSRVDAVNVAVMKARTVERSLAGSVAASDAFFPFRDGLDAIAAAGATAIVQPGGSVRDAEVIAAADEHGLAMVLTGRRHFRH
ncbi:MAG: bifunctional phosphoribosylaminoimidazolecarboxamide formyltransferase/IMP cyclohydrolase PurH, partial [Acidobacteria bacterium]